MPFVDRGQHDISTSRDIVAAIVGAVKTLYQTAASTALSLAKLTWRARKFVSSLKIPTHTHTHTSRLLYLCT